MIGKNVKIGVGVVVLKDVLDDVIVVGVLVKVVWIKGEKVRRLEW